MKKIFLAFSFFIISIFLVCSINQQNEILNFVKYRSFTITKSSSVTSKEEFEKNLNQIAFENKSLIAKRIVQPSQSGHYNFQYQLFGQESESLKAPEYLSKASENAIVSSDVLGSYILITGDISLADTVDKIQNLGYKVKPLKKSTVFNISNQIVTNEAIFFALIVFMLTFLGISLVIRIKDLKYAGIRLISGESILKLITRTIKKDFFNITFSYFLFSILSILLLMFLNIFSMFSVQIVLIVFAEYSLILFFISILLSVVYILGLNYSNILMILKGKLPTKKIMSVMLIGQFLAIVLIGIMVQKSIYYVNTYQDQQTSNLSWDKYNDYYKATLYGSAGANSTSQDLKNYFLKISNFTKDAIQNHQAMLVQKNYNETDKSKVDEIYVTPNYLEFENISLSNEQKNQLNNLGKGDFGLLIPQNVQGEKNQLISKYKNDLQILALETTNINSDKLYSINNPTVALLKNSENRFLLNSSESDGNQYAKDPIIIVISPDSITDSSSSTFFWGIASQSDIYFKNFEDTINLMKKHNVYKEFSYLVNARSEYLLTMQDTKIQTVSLIASSILALVTCILLFTSMILLYFEQFRRDIFIKHVSGANFLSIHFEYLFYEILIIIVGIVVSYMMIHNIIISTVLFILLCLILFIILYIQMIKEERSSVTIMKGK
ncbi:DUF1430 domain-containing protein [Holzapfeliella sp. JNUCC 80]